MIPVLFFLSIPLVFINPYLAVVPCIIALYYNYQLNGGSVPAPKPKASHSDANLTLFMYRKHKYMNSEAWYSKKRQVYSRDNHRCRLCGSTQSLSVHHLRGYNLIPHEPISNLVLLCQACHDHQHFIHGFPQTYEDYMSWDVKLITP